MTKKTSSGATLVLSASTRALPTPCPLLVCEIHVRVCMCVICVYFVCIYMLERFVCILECVCVFVCVSVFVCACS